MLLSFFRAEDMNDHDRPDLQKVRNQGSMTLPPEGFRAHDRGPLPAGKGQQAIDSGMKLRSLHMIGVAAKGRVAPIRIRRVRPDWAAAAEFREMSVADVRLRERSGDLFLAKLRVATRT